MRCRHGWFCLTLLLILGIRPNRVWAENDTLWSRIYGGFGDDRQSAITADAVDGSFAFLCTIAPDTSTSNRGVMNCSADGDSLWFWGTARSRTASLLTHLDDGGCIVTGTGSYGQTLDIRKLDAGGGPAWHLINLPPTWEIGFTAQLILGDGSIITGGLVNRYHLNTTVFLWGVSGQGDSLWLHTYGTDWTDDLRGVTTAAGNGFLLAGVATNAGRSDIFLIRTDREGNQAWQQIHGGQGASALKGIWEDDGGNFIALVKWYDTNNFGLVVFDEMGDVDDRFRPIAGLGLSDVIDSGIRRSENEYIFTGHSTNNGNRTFIISCTPHGELLWRRNIGVTDVNRSPSTCLTPDGGMLVACTENALYRGDRQNKEIWVGRYSEYNGVPRFGSPLPTLLSLTAWPNPFNGRVNLRIGQLGVGEVQIGIYSMDGRRIAFFDNPSRSLSWDAGNLPSGSYFIDVASGRERQIHTIQLVR